MSWNNQDKNVKGYFDFNKRQIWDNYKKSSVHVTIQFVSLPARNTQDIV